MPSDASIFSGVCSLTYVQTEHEQTSCFQMNSETFRMLFKNWKKDYENAFKNYKNSTSQPYYNAP